MKKYLFCIVAIFCIGIFTNKLEAQRVVIIDMRYILSRMPEYANADTVLRITSKKWEREIARNQTELDKMRKNFEAEQYMLTDELKKKREIEISNKEKYIRDLNGRYFGFEGQLFQERKRLVQPIQDKIDNVVRKMAVTHGYDLILDKSEGITVIFADPKLNKSDEVLQNLGIKIK